MLGSWMNGMIRFSTGSNTLVGQKTKKCTLLFHLLTTLSINFVFIFFLASDARIWSLSKRERSRIFEKATEHQKQFLCLPLHVFKDATNIKSLIDFSVQQSDCTVDAYVEQIHNSLPKIKKWSLELDYLKFADDSDPDTSEVERKSSAIPKRGIRKRKVISERTNTIPSSVTIFQRLLR